MKLKLLIWCSPMCWLCSSCSALFCSLLVDLNPKLLTHPEQVKVLRFALKPHLEFLKTLDEVLAESSDESSKTA